MRAFEARKASTRDFLLSECVCCRKQFPEVEHEGDHPDGGRNLIVNTFNIRKINYHLKVALVHEWSRTFPKTPRHIAQKVKTRVALCRQAQSSYKP